MLFAESLPFIKAFIEKLNKGIEKHQPGSQLSFAQRAWLSFCLTGILITNSVCWAKFERASLGTYSVRALSWMFRYSSIPWESLLQNSVILILEEYGLTEGVLVVDVRSKKRSKSAKKIHHLHKLLDKTSGGYVNGQTVVLLLLVTQKITIPVAFAFYIPDPALTAWYKEDKKLKKAGITKKNRPKQPEINPNYPTKQVIALTLLKQFQDYHPKFKVKVIVADALYGSKDFMDKASAQFKDIQVISQLRNNQNVFYQGHKIDVTKYFARHPGTPQKVRCRGGQFITVIVSSARLYVKAHGKKRFIVAIKYSYIDEYRYLVASDMSWRTLDIVQAYTYRWQFPVFFEDWKLYEGWGQLAKQPGVKGYRSSLILSLLLDHCLLLHPEQKGSEKNKLPASTVGSLQRKIQVESLLAFIHDLLLVPNPEEKLAILSKKVKEIFQIAHSSKHMNNRDLGRLEPTPSLKHRAKVAATT